MSGDTEALARKALSLCEARGLMLATAESCTGGMIAAALTDIAGSSAVFDRSFVTYSNEAKQEMLGVNAETLAEYGTVSEQTARQMAEGALAHSRADIALSVTGIAGPGGGSAEKPVGLVWFGLAQSGRPTEAQRQVFNNADRAGVRAAACLHGLAMLVAALEA